MTVATFLTDFADQAVILPLAAVVAIALWWAGWRRGALAWGFGIGLSLGTLGALKLLAVVCDGLPLMTGVHSPSGHTASAAAAFGALAAMMLQRCSRTCTALLATLAGLLIGATRIAVGAHVPGEVTAGMMVGVAGATLTVWLAGPRPADLPRRTVALGVLAVLVSAHGQHLKAESRLKAAGGWIRDHFELSRDDGR